MAIKFVNYSGTAYTIDTNSGKIIPSPDAITENIIRAQVGLSELDTNGNHLLTPIAPIQNLTTGTASILNSLFDPTLSSIQNTLSSTNYSYPSNLGENKSNQTYIQFKSFDFSDIQKSNEIYKTSSFGDANISDFAQKAISLTSSIQPYSKDIIKLYVPPSINVSYGANWGQASLGPIASGAKGTENIYNTAVSKGVESLATILEKLPGANLTGEQLIGLTTGLIYNKNEFSTFTNINLRTFSYSFLFVARNQPEQKQINQIINVFKLGMHPAKAIDVVEGQALNIPNARPPVLKYPKLWIITYKIGSKDNQYIPKTKYCAITDLKLNYTPSSLFTTLTDGAIPAIQMDISFKELTPLTADQIQNSSLIGSDFTGNLNSDYSQNGAIF
jgi:hypothetical protein